MAKIIWSDNALSDLNEIGEYISLHSLKYAAKTVEYLFYSVDILKIYPLAGKIVLDFNSDKIREIVRGNYRIVYKIHSKTTISILAVHHGARFMNDVILDE